MTNDDGGCAQQATGRRTFAARLKECRSRSDLPLKAVAMSLGVSTTTVNDWEHARRFPTGTHLDQLSHFFRIPVCAFFCADPEHCSRITNLTPTCSAPLSASS